MKIAICDDEPIYIETTSRLLQKWAGEHGIESRSSRMIMATI